MLNKLKQLKLKRWQLWILILVALWMIYSGVTQLQREEKGPFGNTPCFFAMVDLGADS